MKSPIHLLLIFLITFALSFEAKASHCAGGELIYEWVEDSTYRVFFKFYRDCTGSPAGTQIILCINNSCSPPIADNIDMTLWTGLLPGGRNNGDPVEVGCSQYPTKCELSSSSIPGYNEFWYSALITLPKRCGIWTLSVAVSARNKSANTATSGYMYVKTTLNNEKFQENSSPYFTIPPIPYMCINTPFTYNNGVIDPDGDSIVIDVVNPYNATCGALSPNYLPMAGGISFPTNPLYCNNTFKINPGSGQFSFTPSLAGAHTITTSVKEYRQGVQIGEIYRDVQIQVLPCSYNNQMTPDILKKTLVNAKFSNNTITTNCGSNYLSFCFDVKASEKGTILKVADNHLVATPGATMTYFNIGSDSVRGCFEWFMQNSDTGYKNLVIYVKDSTCRPPGLAFTQAFSYPIKVSPIVNAPKVSLILSATMDSVCQYDTVIVSNTDTNVYPNGTYSWDLGPEGYASGDNPYKLGWTTSGLKYAMLTVTNGICDSSDIVDIYVKPAPIALFGVKDEACAGEEVELKLEETIPSEFTWTIDENNIYGKDYKPSHKLSWEKGGKKMLSLSVRGRNGCGPVVHTDFIEIHQPEAWITGVTGETYCLGDTLLLTAKQEDGYLYEWEPEEHFLDNTLPEVSYICQYTSGVNLRVTDIFGCSNERNLPIYTETCCKIFLPDAFTPNGDGHNDYFRIITGGHHEVKTFMIKNRWGNTIFKGDNQYSGWNGIVNGKQADPGVYFYYIDYICGDKVHRYSRQGTFILLR